MTNEERQLLIVAARAILASAVWGLHTGIDPKMRRELDLALEAFNQSQRAEAFLSQQDTKPRE